MEPNNAGLQRLARRAYELGRLRLALRSWLYIAPMIALSLAGCQKPSITLSLGAVLLFLSAGLLWRGQSLGRAVGAGLFAGAAPLLMPLLMRGAGHCCVNGACWSVCLTGCITGGLVAGVVIGARGGLLPAPRGAFLAASAAIAGLVGALGCVVAGAAGVVAMIGGFLLGSAPVLVGARLLRG